MTTTSNGDGPLKERRSLVRGLRGKAAAAKSRLSKNGRNGRVAPDRYNGRVGVEQGEGRPQSETDSTTTYEQLIDGLPLKDGMEPLIVSGPERRHYIGVKDAAEIAKITEGYVHGLIGEGRFEAAKFNSRATLIDLEQFKVYVNGGRRPMGRPSNQKTP